MGGFCGAIQSVLGVFSKIGRSSRTGTDSAPRWPALPRALAGTHLAILRNGRKPHHVIGIGGGKVVHLGAHRVHEDRRAVRCDMLKDLARECISVEVVARPDECGTDARITARAKSLIGTFATELPVDDSEAFAKWCLVGKWIPSGKAKRGSPKRILVSFGGAYLLGHPQRVGAEGRPA